MLRLFACEAAEYVSLLQQNWWLDLQQLDIMQADSSHETSLHVKYNTESLDRTKTRSFSKVGMAGRVIKY